MITFSQVHEMCPDIEYDFKPLKNYLNRIISLLHRRSMGDLLNDVANLYHAKTLLESSIIYIQNMIDPKLNSHIKDYEKDYYLLIDNMGRWNKKLDTTAGVLTSSYGAEIKREFVTKMRLLKEMIIQGLENLIYQPLINASYKLENSKGANSRVDLYGYFVFFNLSNTTFILAPVTREESGIRKKSGTSTFEPPTMPPFPEGVTPKSPEESPEESEEVSEYYSSEPEILSEDEDDEDEDD